MIGRHRGFISFLKKAVPGVLTVHCVIHKQHLVAKNLSGRLYKSMNTVITAVNKIKAHSLNSRLFRQLCIDNDEEFERLLLHTEVRWLSNGNCLKRFYSLFDTVVEFFQDSNTGLCDDLKNIKDDIAYLSDIFTKFNEVNLELQGNDVNLIKVKSAISTFLSKCKLFKRNLARHELYQFPSLCELDKEKSISDDDLQVYCAHVEELQRDMSERFQDLLFAKNTRLERGFSAVALLLSKQRNRLRITERGDLRLLLSELQPDVEKLISLHQVQPSH
ncbi:hypothetical protein RRG08_056455 [Elysia crispata]|nr:hypothetical protein RRG08_056455 [Elysia crispata]